MKKKYEGERDKEFVAHVCTDHPRGQRVKDGAEPEKGKYWKRP
jgi:hypothetical protein